MSGHRGQQLRPRQSHIFDALRLGVFVQEVDGRHRAGRAEHLEEHALGVVAGVLQGVGAGRDPVLFDPNMPCSRSTQKPTTATTNTATITVHRRPDEATYREPLHPRAFREQVPAATKGGSPSRPEVQNGTVRYSPAQASHRG